MCIDECISWDRISLPLAGNLCAVLIFHRTCDSQGDSSGRCVFTYKWFLVSFFISGKRYGHPVIVWWQVNQRMLEAESLCRGARTWICSCHVVACRKKHGRKKCSFLRGETKHKTFCLVRKYTSLLLVLMRSPIPQWTEAERGKRQNRSSSFCYFRDKEAIEKCEQKSF